MFRRILVPIDGSAFAEHAIPYAAKIAMSSDAKLELALVHVTYPLTVADTSTQGAVAEWEREHERVEALYLRELAERVGAASNRDVEPILLGGDIVSVLEHEIAERGIDLVVITTHGRAGLERAWLGSVADTLIRHVAAPVLVIRPSGDEPIAADSAAPPFAHVLIALDGSERAEQALAPATALARMDAARVTLLRAVAPPFAMASPYLPHAIQLARTEQERREDEARSYIEGKVRELKMREVDAAGEVLLDYHPAHALLRFTDTHRVDLIALGTHGYGPMKRLVLGSVSDKVVRAANVPVLVC